ncbi:tail protein [Vibrio phage D69]
MTTKLNNRMIDGAAVNVRDFGAVGDGVTDDTAAWQLAVGSGTVVLGNPGDVYLISSQIDITSETHIDLRHSELSSLWVDNASGRHSTLLFNVVGVRGFTLENGKLEGNRARTGFQEAVSEEFTSPLVRLDTSERVVIRNILIDGYGSDVVSGGWDVTSQYGWAVIKAYLTNDLTYDNVEITDSISEGIYNTQCDNLTAVNLDIHDNSSSFITPFHAWYCENVVITDSKITLSDTELSGSTLNVYSRHVRISNNYIRGGNSLDIGNEAGDMWTAFNVLIENNVLYECKIKGDLGENTKINDLKISNNNIRAGSRGQGIYLGGLINRSEISSNTIQTAGATDCIAVRLSAATDNSGLQPHVTSDVCNIYGNTLIGEGASAYSTGINFSRQVRASNVNIYDNIVKYCACPVYLGSLAKKATYTDFRIYSNTLIVPPGTPYSSGSGSGMCVFLVGDSSDTLLESILVDGLDISNNYMETESTCVYISLSGIPVGKSITRLNNFYITDNTFHLTADGDVNKSGVVVSGSGETNGFINDVRILRNNIDTQSLGENGVYASRVDNLMISNNLIGSHTYGITLATEIGGDYVRIEDNTILNPPVSFRHTSSFTDNTTLKFINRNPGATRGATLNFTDRGPVVDRPHQASTLTYLYDGLEYFDETRERPVYYRASSSTSWVYSDGSEA